MLLVKHVSVTLNTSTNYYLFNFILFQITYQGENATIKERTDKEQSQPAVKTKRVNEQKSQEKTYNMKP
jgi:hypothetical protein